MSRLWCSAREVAVKGFTDSSKNRFAEGLESFISVDNRRAFVTLGELAQFREVDRIVLPSFSKQRNL